jgi:hypothetical protein
MLLHYNILLFVGVCFCRTSAFTSLQTVRKLSSSLASTRKAYLDERSLWRIVFKLQKDSFDDIEATVRVRFIEDRGYEPPQGRIFVENDYNGLIRVDEKGYSAFRWSLSEDKNARKGGLWVWGLFEEPKYPYLYLSFAVYDDVLCGEEVVPIFGGQGIPKNKLNIRFTHAPDKERGAVLTDGVLTYQVTETVKADPLGLGGSVDVGESTKAGLVSIQPVYESE